MKIREASSFISAFEDEASGKFVDNSFNVNKNPNTNT